MRLVSWNTNHRAGRHRIPAWIGSAITTAEPDVVVLTEYIVGPDHAAFLKQLENAGLSSHLISGRVGRSNQVMVIANEPMTLGDSKLPADPPSAPANFLHVRLDRSNIDVVGFRMLSFDNPRDASKRRIWEAVLQVLDSLKHKRALIAGDFNTAPGDAAAFCGDCLESLIASEWQLAEPGEGKSWPYSGNGPGRRIDHAFLSSSLRPVSALYDWSFRELAGVEHAPSGVPDHAILKVEFITA
jgi:endonuclease/exonuclease/phosphatase family metal-dependent hydrolase